MYILFFAFDIDEHTLEQINLNLLPKEEKQYRKIQRYGCDVY